MKYIISLIFFIFSFSATASIERSIYLTCDSCYSVDELANAAENNFRTKYISDVNQKYYYTVVNDSSQIAAFIDIQRRYDDREPGVPPIDVVQVKVLTLESELYSDYQLAEFVLRNDSGEVSQFSILGFFRSPKIKEVTINGSIHDASYGISAFRSHIISALKSNISSAQWAKLGGRSVIKVNFDDGSLLTFFVGINTSDMYVYLGGTAIDENGDPVSIDLGVGNVGGSSGEGGNVSGSGTWYPSGAGKGGIVCTGIHGNVTCRWQYY